MIDACWIYSTFPDLGVAKQIAQTLVADEWVACANLIPHVQSIYRWQGKVQCDEEVAVFFKVETIKVQEALAEIRKLHPYQCPALIRVDWDGINEDYRRWMHE